MITAETILFIVEFMTIVLISDFRMVFTQKSSSQSSCRFGHDFLPLADWLRTSAASEEILKRPAHLC